MRTHSAKVHVKPNQPLVVHLPADVPETAVEVIVPMLAAPSSAPAGPNKLREFDTWLREQPPSGRTKTQIDGELETERANWD